LFEFDLFKDSISLITLKDEKGADVSHTVDPASL
jgi:hypothetical protein